MVSKALIFVSVMEVSKFSALVLGAYFIPITFLERSFSLPRERGGGGGGGGGIP